MLFYDAMIKRKHFEPCYPLGCNIMWAPHHDGIWETRGIVPCIPKTCCYSSVNNQLHTWLLQPSGEKPPFFIKQEAMWAPEPAWTLQRRKKYLHHAIIYPQFLTCPTDNIVTILNKVLQLWIKRVNNVNLRGSHDSSEVMGKVMENKSHVRQRHIIHITHLQSRNIMLDEKQNK